MRIDFSASLFVPKMFYPVLLLLLFATKPAQALYLTSDFDSNIGYSSINVSVGENFQRTLDSTSTLEMNYNINFSGANSAAQISFFEILDSQMGYLPLTRLAMGFRYFPFGLNGAKNILDNGAQGKLWRASPFFAANAGFTNISIRDPVGSFNAFVVDGLFKVGVEIPVATDWLILGQFGYLMSLIGESDSNPDSTVSYGGIIMLAGVKLTTF